MPDLILGPVLRHVGTDDATVWVETDAPCEVEVLGHGERTFTVAGHHYALVRIENLRPREVHPYDVRVDGRRDPEGREFDALYRLARELLGRPRAPTCC
jgi:hypothetical protein